MTLRSIFTVAVFLSLSPWVLAVDHRVEKSAEAPPVDAIGAEIAGKLDPAGIQVIRGTSRTVCEIWLCKDLEINAGAITGEVQYPFKEGQLIGVVRYPREGSDFRDQDIAEGVYTMRYALQPVDGAHVGTFPTRDFVLLSKAEADQSAAPVELKTLVTRATEAAETAHPAFLALLKLEGKPEAYPGIAHNEEHDWWIVRLEAQTRGDGGAAKLPVDLVVSGRAAE